MSGRSRPVLRLVTGPRPGGTVDEVTGGSSDGPHTPDPADLVDVAGLASSPAGADRAAGRPDVAGLCAEIDADVARLGGSAGSAAGLRSRWETVRRLCDPTDLGHLADHAESLYEAAESVRRQHVETAEDLGPLWDAWEGPAAEAVQDRVSALARSAHALVVELETTAGRLRDAHDRVVDTVEALADDLAARPTGGHDAPAVWDHAASACAQAWDDARRVLAGGRGADVSRSGPRSP